MGTDGTAQTFTFTDSSITANQLLNIAGGITGSTGSGLKGLTIAGAGNTAISGIIGNGTTGSVGLTMTGSGTLTLSGGNTYTGGTTIDSGIVLIGVATPARLASLWVRKAAV